MLSTLEEQLSKLEILNKVKITQQSIVIKKTWNFENLASTQWNTKTVSLEILETN